MQRQLLEERQLIRQEILSPMALVSLVRSYLLHSGFKNTLQAFNKAVAEPKPTSESGKPAYPLSTSCWICRLLGAGKLYLNGSSTERRRSRKTYTDLQSNPAVVTPLPNLLHVPLGK